MSKWCRISQCHFLIQQFGPVHFQLFSPTCHVWNGNSFNFHKMFVFCKKTIAWQNNSAWNLSGTLITSRLWVQFLVERHLNSSSWFNLNRHLSSPLSQLNPRILKPLCHHQALGTSLFLCKRVYCKHANSSYPHFSISQSKNKYKWSKNI